MTRLKLFSYLFVLTVLLVIAIIFRVCLPPFFHLDLSENK
jgi:hypothetical protein